MAGVEEMKVERWLELLCFLSTLLADHSYRTHFTDPGQIPNHALTLTFIVSWRRRSSTKQELGVRAAGENLIRKIFDCKLGPEQIFHKWICNV